MKLLHNIDVVPPGSSRPAPAHIFKAAGHVLLPVEIVGGKPRAPQGGGSVIQHGGHLLHCGNPGALQGDTASLLQGKGVNGDIVCAESDDLVQSPPEALRRILRQPGDEVHVHVGEA